jgi:predicted neuraminidase
MDRQALVYKGMPPNITCCDQALRIMPDGEWIVFFMTGGCTEPELANFVALCRSTDQGETWGPLEVVLQRDDRGCTMTEVVVDDGQITIFVNIHRGWFDGWTNYTITSTDAGHTWTAPELFTPLPHRGFIRNRFVMPTGEWLFPYQYYPPTGDPEASPLDDGSFTQMQVGVLTTADQGRTWTDSSRVAGQCWAENNLVRLSDGRLVMLARADGTGCLWRSESTDGGRTWSELVRTDIPNPGSKFRLWQLRDGRVVMVHNPNPQTSHPNSKHYASCNRNPLALWVSDDDLQTWGYRRVLVDFPGHLAYPDGVVDEAEAYVHFVFDYNRHDVIYYGAKLP